MIMQIIFGDSFLTGNCNFSYTHESLDHESVIEQYFLSNSLTCFIDRMNIIQG